MRYQLDAQMRCYVERLHALSDQDLDRFSDYGSPADRLTARYYASDVCGRLFSEEMLRSGKEARYILTTKNLSAQDLVGLQDLANQTKLIVRREGEIFVVVVEAKDPQGQQKLWANMVLRGLDGNRLRQCYEVVCRKLYIPDPIKASIQENCGQKCGNRRRMRSYLPGYRKRKKKGK